MRRTASIVTLSLVLVTTACAKPSAPPEKQEAPVTSTQRLFSTEPRSAKPRGSLPAAVAPLVPRRGIYVAGGGLVSSPWRVIVDADARTLAAGRSQGANQPSYGKLEHEVARAVGDRELAELVTLADGAWREPAAPFASPIADYDEILIVADGEDAFFLQGYGPIRAKIAAELIARLRAAIP